MADAGADRAGWKAARQMVVLGVVAGGAVKMLGLARGRLDGAIESV